MSVAAPLLSLEAGAIGSVSAARVRDSRRYLVRQGQTDDLLGSPEAFCVVGLAARRKSRRGGRKPFCVASSENCANAWTRRGRGTCDVCVRTTVESPLPDVSIENESPTSCGVRACWTRPARRGSSVSLRGMTVDGSWRGTKFWP